ncbi:MAG: Cullin-3 [Cirrosporium novae-zelandiae]|nr:MAG: Cullin-3 [Cirrosporium novae-zelandiae]
MIQYRTFPYYRTSELPTQRSPTIKANAPHKRSNQHHTSNIPKQQYTKKRFKMMSNRRGKIRAPRRGLGSSESLDYHKSWDAVARSLQEIHTRNASKLSFEELYRTAYRIVLKKNGGQFYDDVKKWESDWLKTQILERIRSLLSTTLITEIQGSVPTASTNERRAAGERLLKGVTEAWDDHTLCMNLITDVLMYLDRVYCHDARKPSIYPACMALFRDQILLSSIVPDAGITVFTLVINVILDQIRMEREGDVIDKTLIRSCVQMLERLYESEDEHESTKLYLKIFEPEFLRASRLFYQNEGATLLRQGNAPAYCRQVRRRLTEEAERCRSMLTTTTENSIKSVIDDEMIRRNIEEVIKMEGSGVKHMLDNNQIIELQFVYELISRVDPQKVSLKKAVANRVYELGVMINKSASAPQQATASSVKQDQKAENGTKIPSESKAAHQQNSAAITWVDEIIRLKSQYDSIWETAFDKDQGMQATLSQSFTEFVNAFQRASEYLSLFFDENLKKGLKGKTEMEVDELLDKGITLLRYISDKDMFEMYYKRHLARRLLMKRSVSMDAEQQMIAKMKMEVGNSFTQKLESMFKDMKTSTDLTQDYKKYVTNLGDPDPARIELDAHILTNTMWPVEIMMHDVGEDQPQCRYPPEVERIKQAFETFYLKKYNGRRLTWQPTMGTADIRATFPKAKGKEQRRELNVTTYAMIILLLFNDLESDQSLTFQEIQAETNIPANALIRNLQSLAVAPKTRVLIKEPMSKEIDTTDKFRFNESFYSQFAKIKICAVASGNRVEAPEERKATQQKRDEGRNGAIEAAVVRIMKQRKELQHQQLLAEVITQLASRFSPDINMVKKRIESLIEREYLERVEDAELPAYRYLA